MPSPALVHPHTPHVCSAHCACRTARRPDARPSRRGGRGGASTAVAMLFPIRGHTAVPAATTERTWLWRLPPRRARGGQRCLAAIGVAHYARWPGVVPAARRASAPSSFGRDSVRSLPPPCTTWAMAALTHAGPMPGRSAPSPPLRRTPRTSPSCLAKVKQRRPRGVCCAQSAAWLRTPPTPEARAPRWRLLRSSAFSAHARLLGIGRTPVRAPGLSHFCCASTPALQIPCSRAQACVAYGRLCTSRRK